MRVIVAMLICALPAYLLSAEGPEGYYRDPTIHGDTIVFAAEGDLWTVRTEGGVALRLTTHPESEREPVISPDGATLAFSASYEGPTEVYTMPIFGGLPTRRTYEGAGARLSGARVVGWTPDGRLLYTTSRYSTLPNVQLVALALKTGERTLVPLARTAFGTYDRPNGTLFFTRNGEVPNRTGFGSETRGYKGGQAPHVWKFAPEAREAVPLTADYAGISARPMWWDGRVYFESDRGGTMNLWSMNPDGDDVRQHTFHVGWDVQDPALQGGRIVYQLGADIWLYDIGTSQDRRVPITLASDFDQQREHWVNDPVRYLESAHVAPDGDRVVLTARGRVFVAPAGPGRFVEVTPGTSVRYRDARFLDERSLIVLSDQSGEVEWWTIPANGLGHPRQVTRNGTTLRHDGLPSPDGKWLITYDHAEELWLYNTESGESERIDVAPRGGISGLRWSADSRWLAYARLAENAFSRIYVYNAETGTHLPITTDRYDSYSPAWSGDGKWIYFLSKRHFESLVQSPYGRNAEPFFPEQVRLYAIALQADSRWPFQPADELRADSSRSGSQTTKSGMEPQGARVPVSIDLDGIERRLYQVPVAPGDYDDLTASGDRLFWVSRPLTPGAELSLWTLQIRQVDLAPKKLVEGIRADELSANGEKLLVHKGNNLYVIAAGENARLDEGRVDLSGWKFVVNPKDEWRQMFVEAWRLERDYFYDQNMHGVDWPAMLRKYLPLVDRVTTRDELNDLEAQMVSELSALHTFVYGGDSREGADHIDLGSLGAVLTRAESAGGYRVDHIYQTDPDEPDQRAPLAMPSVDVEEGDIIEAVNGVPTLTVTDIRALLRNQAGRQVRLAVKGGGRGPTRDVIVTAISIQRDADLRYDEWEYTRRLMTEDLGGGAVGYVHLRGMHASDMAEWQRSFYPVATRPGLIIDLRHTGGGNIDRWVLERLLRKAWAYNVKRNHLPDWNREWAFRGHLVMLVDQNTISDGEIAAEGFRRLGLGQVIGTRTWGGGLALTWSNGLVDGGIATAGEWGLYSPEGEWLVEGHGVDPDITVDNLPHATFEGEDAQLRAAIAHLQRLIREDPRPVPPPPPYPDKSSRQKGVGQ